MDNSDCVDQNDVLARVHDLAEQDKVIQHLERFDSINTDPHACRFCGAFVSSGTGTCDPCQERES